MNRLPCNLEEQEEGEEQEEREEPGEGDFFH
jgi:hypothetical protein